ncbi:Putative quercetin 2,3-dioxygenase Rv0181c [Microbacterium sp. Bi98]|uniref:pirin family protein n=1 Tax=unclassified Microbacterium TaxID=2609290 RepID=UPI0006FB798B|nr:MULTISPECIES: pirin family protein [unclassified Microbacterium]KRD54162.1 pirin [Microbacterium sp. Root280D1]CAH0205246.1 Putative quercetin 2,3-dioxygenase Rv0181c [Microbacterium sp. Bi98]
MIGERRIVLEPREVPLGGVRGMNVLRVLPHRNLPTIGAWCFLDRFGPADTRMRVEPHPHIGLQTVTWPLVGEIRHRDSVGSDADLRRGQLNLMTAGNGISHSEYSIGDDPIPLDALQFWVVLPESSRHGAAGFERHTELPQLPLPADEGQDATATVVLGEFAGTSSPATVHTPIVGAEIRIPAGARLHLPLRSGWEHGLMLVEGDAVVATHGMSSNDMLYLGDSRDSVEVSSAQGALLFLIGGEPFEDEIVMWWNFAGRTHEEIVEARTEWEAASARFGVVEGHDVRIPAPPLPDVRLMPRGRKI